MSGDLLCLLRCWLHCWSRCRGGLTLTLKVDVRMSMTTSKSDFEVITLPNRWVVDRPMSPSPKLPNWGEPLTFLLLFCQCIAFCLSPFLGDPPFCFFCGAGIGCILGSGGGGGLPCILLWWECCSVSMPCSAYCVRVFNGKHGYR